MTYALIIVAKADGNNQWPDSMHRVLYKMPLPAGVTKLNESAWLVRLDSCLLFLAGLIQIAHTDKLPHHVLFLEKEPSFFHAPQNPA